MTVELLLRSWITGLDDDIQWSELFLLRVQDLGILGNSGISGQLSAIPAEFVFAEITGKALSVFSAIPVFAEIAEMLAGIAENSQILDNAQIF